LLRCFKDILDKGDFYESLLSLSNIVFKRSNDFSQ